MNKREFVCSKLNEVASLDWLAEECVDLVKSTLKLSRMVQSGTSISETHAENAVDISTKLARVIAAFHVCCLKSEDFATDRELHSLEEEKFDEWAKCLEYVTEGEKTLKDALLEQLPNAAFHPEGYPKICPDHIWKGFEEDCSGKCSACWNRPASLIQT